MKINIAIATGIINGLIHHSMCIKLSKNYLIDDMIILIKNSKKEYFR